MASTLKFDSERREMRRERHEARVARKRERQQARQLKHAHQGDAVRMPVVAIERPAPAPLVESGAHSSGQRGRGCEGAGAAARRRLTRRLSRSASRSWLSANATSRRSSRAVRRWSVRLATRLESASSGLARSAPWPMLWAPWRTPARRLGGDIGSAWPRRLAPGESRSSGLAPDGHAGVRPATRRGPRGGRRIRSSRSPSRSPTR